MGTPLAAFAIIAPWLVWLPVVTSPAAAILLGAVAIAGAFHGLGRLVARAANRTDVGAALAMVWGVAAMVAVAGVMLAFGRYDARLLVLLGCAAHSADVAIRFVVVREELDAALRWNRARFWIVPMVLVAAVAVINILGAAGQVARPFDDECNVLAQVQRLSTTGALHDAIGFPRVTQLGGHVTLGALATIFGDASLATIVDRGLGLVLFLLLVCSQTRLRSAESAIWTSLIVLVAASLRLASPDLLPFWIPAMLIVGVHATLTTTTPATARAMLPIGLLAGALCVIRTELVVLAIAVIAVAGWQERTAGLRDWRRVATLVSSALGVVAVYGLARHSAVSGIGTAASALLTPRSSPFLVRLGLFAAIACAVIPLVSLAMGELGDRVLRRFAIVLVIGITAISTRLVGAPGSSQLWWPLALAGVTVVAISLAQVQELRRTAMVVAMLACILIADAKDARGRRGWASRYYDLMFDVEFARNLPRAAGEYGDALARVPAGERVAVWVSRPELVDYERNPIIDLRIPTVAKWSKPERLERLVAATHASWLLVDASGEDRFDWADRRFRTVVDSGNVRLLRRD